MYINRTSFHSSSNPQKTGAGTDAQKKDRTKNPKFKNQAALSRYISDDLASLEEQHRQFMTPASLAKDFKTGR